MQLADGFTSPLSLIISTPAVVRLERLVGIGISLRRACGTFQPAISRSQSSQFDDAKYHALAFRTALALGIKLIVNSGIEPLHEPRHGGAEDQILRGSRILAALFLF